MSEGTIDNDEIKIELTPTNIAQLRILYDEYLHWCRNSSGSGQPFERWARDTIFDWLDARCLRLLRRRDRETKELRRECDRRLNDAYAADPEVDPAYSR